MAHEGCSCGCCGCGYLPLKEESAKPTKDEKENKDKKESK